jgi:hypothetical protein
VYVLFEMVVHEVDTARNRFRMFGVIFAASTQRLFLLCF